MTTRRFEYNQADSSKFWEISVDADGYDVSYGRIGTDGQHKRKDVADPAKEAAKLIASKVKKGYVETTAGSTPVAASATAATGQKNTAKKPAKKAVKQTAVQEILDPDVYIDIPESYQWWVGPRQDERNPLPPAEAFDHKKACQRLKKVRRVGYGWEWSFVPCAFHPLMDQDEAHFWLTVLMKIDNKIDVKQLVNQMEQWNGDATEPDVFFQHFADNLKHLGDEIVIPIVRAFGIDVVVEHIATQGMGGSRNSRAPIALGLRRHCWPYLDAATRQAQADRLKQAFANSFPNLSRKAEIMLAACAFGDVSCMQSFQKNWNSDRMSAVNEPVGSWFHCLAVCTDSEEMLHTARLFNHRWLHDPSNGMSDECFAAMFQSDDDICVWLSLTGDQQLHVIAMSFMLFNERYGNDKAAAMKLGKSLMRIRSPRMVRPCLDIILKSPTPGIGRDWLLRHPHVALQGLLPLAAEAGAAGSTVQRFIAQLIRRGHGSIVEEFIHTVPDEATAMVQALLDEGRQSTIAAPDALADHLAAASSGKIAKGDDFVAGADLPPLALDTGVLDATAMDGVLRALAKCSISEAHSAIAWLREHATDVSKDRFAWSLFQEWLGASAPSKQKWAMLSIGWLGGEACARQLTPLVKVWPGESQHQRAVLGLECLRLIGSEAALMHLSSIAAKLKYKGLKAKANEFMEAIAENRGLTRNELDDLVIPDCGLDTRGQCELDFGPRSFVIKIGPDFKPIITDEHGKKRASLPKPNKADDEELADVAKNRFKELKKQVKEVVQIQTTRLEQAMVGGRRWALHNFAHTFVEHPLMRQLAKSLVWGVFTDQDTLSHTFRVTEEAMLVDENDDDFSLPTEGQIALLHPLQLPDTAAAAWGEQLSDYELQQPFAQLGRTVNRVDAAHHEHEDIESFVGLKFAAPSLIYGLEKLGWSRGEVVDAGAFMELYRHFGDAKTSVYVHYEGCVGMGYIEADEILTVEQVRFYQADDETILPDAWYVADKKAKRFLKIGEVNPLAYSEAIYDLERLRERAV